MQNLLCQSVSHQKRLLLIGSLVFPGFILQIPYFLSGSVLAQTNCPRSEPLEVVAERIDRKLSQPSLKRTRWGLEIHQVDQSGAHLNLIYSRQANELFLPASTAKLFTTLALVSAFEEDYQLETPYFAVGQPPTLKQVRVQGVGDPGILDLQLSQMVQRLKSKGVKTIENLIGDSDAFAAPSIVPSWEWADLQTSDGVPITSLSFSQNSLPLQLSPTKLGRPLQIQWLDGAVMPPIRIKNLSKTVSAEEVEYISLERSLAGNVLTIRGQLRVGASPDVSYVAIASPTAYFLHRLKSLLQSEGIRVNRVTVRNAEMPKVSALPAGSKEQLIGAIASSPLSDLLKEINQASNNFHTESLLRHWAWTQQPITRPRAPISSTQSLAALQKALTPLGIDPSSYRLKDASGLSRQNLVSPESLTAVLKAVMQWQSSDPAKYRQVIDSLAIAGQSGTLKRRFQESAVAGKLFAKTGTLSGTVALAGFLIEPGKPTMLLSLMANHSDQSTATLRQTLDEIVQELHQAQSCVQNRTD